MKRWSARGLMLFSLLLLSACVFSAQRRHILDGEKALSENHEGEAFRDFELATHGSDQNLALEGARRAARLAHFQIKKYQNAIDLYRFIIIASADNQERRTAQENIAEIYFENLLYYDKAIVEYEKLLQLDFPPSEKYLFHLNIAKCHHRLGNLEQALVELDALSKEKISEADYYDLQLFHSNVLMSQKRQMEAADILTDLIKKFPERSKKESLAMTLALCLEEAGDFKKAISVLETMKVDYPHPEFLETRIARLKSRVNNAPGAFGLKK